MTGAIETENILQRNYPFVPPFFVPALTDEAAFEALWRETERCLNQEVLPPLLVEKMFVHLARLCPQPYGLLGHPFILFPRHLTIADAIERLKRPPTRRYSDYLENVQLLEQIPADFLLSMIVENKHLEDAFLCCVEYMFWNPSRSQDADRLLLDKLGIRTFFAIIDIMAYVRQCFVWTESHSEIYSEQDQLLAAEIERVSSLQPLRPLLADYWRQVGVMMKQRLTQQEGVLGGMKLRLSEELFRTIFDSSPIGILIVGRDRKVIKANQAFLDMLGYEHGELVNRTVEEFSHSDDHDTSIAFWNKLVAGELSVMQFEKRYIKKDGTVVWVKVNGAMVYTDRHEIAYSVGMIEDITATRHAAEALSVSERRLGEAERLAGIGNWEWVIGAEKVAWSAELYRMYGVNPDTFEPTTERHAALIHTDDRPLLDAMLYRCMETGNTEELDYRIVRADGSMRWARARCIADRDQSGSIIRLFGTSQDITDTKNTHEHLIRMVSLVRHARIPITSIDMDHRYASMNMAAEKMSGFAENEIVGKSIYDYMPEESRQEFRAVLDEVKNGNTAHHFRTKRMKKDGGILEIVMIVSPIYDEHHRQIGYSTMIDV